MFTQFTKPAFLYHCSENNSQIQLPGSILFHNCEIYVPRHDYVSATLSTYAYTIVNMQEGDSSFLQQANFSRFLLLLLCDIKEKNPKSPSLHYFKAKEEKEFHQTESICWPCFNRTFLGPSYLSGAFQSNKDGHYAKGKKPNFP